MSFISIENLTTRYNTSKGLVHALEDVTFAIDKGESIGIAGESACGKSTLGLSIIQMISNGKIYSGKIQFDGKSLLDVSDSDFNKNIRWKEISMVFQGAMNSLDPVFSIQEQFEEVLKQHNFEGDLKQSIINIKNKTKLPVVSGFGIKNREQVKKVCEISDGAVIGSSIVKIIENNINNEEKMITLVANFVKQLKEGIVE